MIKDSHHRTGVRLDFEPEVDFARVTFWKYRSDFYHKLELVEGAHSCAPFEFHEWATFWKYRLNFYHKLELVEGARSCAPFEFHEWLHVHGPFCDAE